MNATLDNAPAEFAAIFAPTGMSTSAIDTLYHIHKAAMVGGAYEGSYSRRNVAELESHDMFIEHCKFSENVYMYPSPRALQMISDATQATFLSYFNNQEGWISVCDDGEDISAVFASQRVLLERSLKSAHHYTDTNPWQKRIPDLYQARSEVTRPGYDCLRFRVTTNYPEVFKHIETFDALAATEELEAA